MEYPFPGKSWSRAEPERVRMDAGKLDAAHLWHSERAEGRPCRVVVVRRGRIAAEWEQGMTVFERRWMASATKSLFSCILGIAVAEGKVGSADDRVIDYYPEFMQVPEGRGPKPGRHAKPEDADITFRQLISNTSGYMKPGETPGKQFHYQTFGMNVLCHAISSAYGLYDSSAPGRLPGMGQLIQEKIRDPIGGSWSYGHFDFDLWPSALTNIFGHGPRCQASARDKARMGLLWLHMGRWGDRQVVPRDWMQEATRTVPGIRANCPPEDRRYGYAFWTNDHGLMWPSLPRDSFAASGAGSNHIWVCPSLDLVVAQSPGVYQNQRDETNRELLERLADACS